MLDTVAGVGADEVAGGYSAAGERVDGSRDVLQGKHNPGVIISISGEMSSQL